MTELLDELAVVAAGCTRCGLCASRTHTAFARGSPRARLMVVGEAPGAEEDAAGIPFVGPSGELLDSMLRSVGIEAYICNAVKCRPPGNRAPTPEELEACRDYLEAQIAEVRPAIILALGRTAMKALGMGFPERWRGRWAWVYGIPALATYHPAYMLRNPAAKKVVGLDLRALLNEYRRQTASE